MATISPTENVAQPDHSIEKNDSTQRTFNDEKTTHQSHDIEKQAHGSTTNTVDGFPDDPSKEGFETSSTHKQDGVKRVEAITSVWSKQSLWIMFALLYLVSFVDMLLVSIQTNLNPYITSSFGQHGLLATISIVSSILGGTSSFTIAKIIDIWGRMEGFLVMLFIIVIGLIMKATCENVETYAAAHTLYWVGHIGLLYVINIIIADMTSLRNRMIMITLTGTPTIATVFAGPAIAELFYEKSNFRWAFGAFCIILVAVSIPAVVIMFVNQRKASRAGMLPEKASTRTKLQSVKYYLVEFDVIGIVLITAGFSLILLPFSLASSSKDKWASADIIVMIVIGVVCLAVFVIWEKFFAPVQFFPFRYLKERTIIGSCLLYGLMFASIFTWDAYYGSYLQVVHNLTITTSGYVLNSFSLTSSFISPFVGYLIRRYGYFKYIAYSGIPFVVLGTALLIPLRTPDTHVGLLVMCQVLNGIGTGIFATCGQIAVMASVTHQEVAVALALWGMFGSIGSSIGFTIAGGIWTNVLPQQLVKHLPEGSKDMAATIYSSLVIQQEYPVGSEIRDAIIAAYGDVQRRMVIAGAVFIPILVVTVWMWKNINVRKLEEMKGKQTRGTVW